MNTISETKKQIVLITGKDPLFLDDPEILAVLALGRADVFFMTLDADGQPLSRHHLARLETGQAAPGFAAGKVPTDPVEGSLARSVPFRGVLVMTGIGDAEVRLVPLAEALEQDPETPAHLLQWRDTCAAALDLALPDPPQTGEEETAPDLAAHPDAIRDLAGQGLLPRAIQAFHTSIALAVKIRQETAETEGRRRYHQQQEGDRRRMAQALHGMAGILTGEKKAAALDGLPPLLGAAIHVGLAAGIRVSEDTFDPESGQVPELDDICRHNRFRAREVVIAEKWRTRDLGPLLGFMEEGNRPVALIPRGSTAYLCIDPETGAKAPVTPALDNQLSSKAYTFYRPFPHQPLNWLGLIRFGIFRSGADFLWLVSMGTLAGLLGLLMPLATGLILGTFIPSAAKNDILQITVILVATALAIAMFNVVKGIATIRLEGRMDLQVQAAVWDRLLALPVPFFKQFTSGDLAVRAMGITAIRQILSGTTLNAVLTLTFTSFNLLFLFYYDWQMALVAILMTSLGATVTLCAGLFTIYFQKTLFEIQGKISGIMLQFITGVNKLRTTGAEERAFTVFAGEYARQKQMNFYSGLVDASLSAFNAAFPVLVSLVLFAWYYWMRPGHLTVAEFIAFTSAYTTFQTALLQVSMVMPNTANIIPLYQRAKPILQALPEVSEQSKKPGALQGTIRVSHVSFRYAPDAPLILDDVSIEARKGEFVAIVGGSGAGKSTLLRLLLGFETPEAGAVFYDSQDLKHLDVREVRRQTGVVLQNGKLMNGDIFRNIAGASSLTVEQAWEAARMVGIADDIEAMPMKLHTMVPAGGGSLSGGQRQRLLIARAIAHQPRILFFDEATSALDNQTQAIVSQSLEQLKVTRIVIAHRLSTIMNADRIYVMHLGRVAESGTYDDLMAQKGLFYDLAKRQIS